MASDQSRETEMERRLLSTDWGRELLAQVRRQAKPRRRNQPVTRDSRLAGQTCHGCHREIRNDPGPTVAVRSKSGATQRQHWHATCFAAARGRTTGASATKTVRTAVVR